MQCNIAPLNARALNRVFTVYTFSLGVNLPDHSVVFSQLVDELKEEITPFAIQLQSKECTSKL